MGTTGKRLGIAALAMCLLVALAFGGISAFADATWHGDGFENSLTVEATDTESMSEDIAKAGVVVDIYRVASAKKDSSFDTYNYTWENYTWEAPFDEGPVKTEGLDANAWNKLAADAAKKLAGAEAQSVTADAGAAIEKLDTGIYLVLAHGRDVEVTFAEDGSVVLKAYSELYEYSYLPVLVAVPSKAADESGAIRTDDAYGPWLADVKVSLKPSRDPLYGSLRIDKLVEGAPESVEPATFVFHITGTTLDGKAYDDYAQVYYTGGASASTTVTHIPAGTRVKVIESYEGARYELVKSDDEEKVIVADRWVTDQNPMAYAAFENQPVGGNPGTGIENRYELSEDGDWHWFSVPDQSKNQPNSNEKQS